MYKLNISTPAFLHASLPISMEVGEFLINRLNQLDSQTIHRDELQQKLGYPVGVGSNSGSFLQNIYNFTDAILKESNAHRFTVQIEAIPAHQKVDSIFKGKDSIPEEGRSVIVIFVDQRIESDVRYCAGCKEWHAKNGNVKVTRIHKWAYTEDFYNLLKLPEFPEAESKSKEDKSMEDISNDLARLFLLKALLGAAKSRSENPRSFF
ncbi:hypothetical protein [Acinetobacter sp. 102]|uniref:hypothetical protein n=1 Tax=Acinetobacter sp. 102 TaxID=3098766 RepID=UPI00300A5981